MSRTREKKDLSRFLLLVSEYSFILFLCWALSVEAGRPERRNQATSRSDVSRGLPNVFVTNPTPVQEEPMQR